MATLIARISEDMMRQYDVVNNSVDYENGEPKLFGKLSPNGNCIFICPTFVLIGDYFSEIPNHSIQFQNVRRLALTNNDLLNLSAYNPEENSRTKASFYGYIQNNQIDINDLEQQYNLSQFISFNIIKEESLAQSINSLNENDRVVTLDSNNRLLELNVIANGSLNELNLGTGYFNAYGNSLDELITLMLSLQKPKTRHVTNINRIKNTLATNNLFRFPSFSDYYNIIHNKSLYANNPPITLGNVNVNKENTFSFKKNMALNTILFGPPGTGKTFNSINEAIEIINPSFDLKQDRRIIKKEYNRLVNEGQIVFTTFHQSMSYEDFIEGIKPKVEEDANENKQVVYEIEDGIFKKLVENAKKYKSNSNEIIENYSFDDAWDELVGEAGRNLENNSLLVLQIQTPNLGLSIIEVTERGNLKLKPIYSDDAKEYTVSYLRAKKLHESFPDLSVIKNIDKEFRAVIGGSNSTAYWSALNFINQKINKKSKITVQATGTPEIPHVLIIDEINRGNVSQIFGELITLIEDSKRLGEVEELEVTLSYSKKKFGIPSNVYIIGTMNTADRSVEALDTALRRRFSFKEIMPDDKVITEKNFKDYDRASIMNLINQRIEVLLDRNYTLGHSYFIKEDFKNSFKNEIIPLLQEYFYNDYGKIGLVLGKGFVREKEITKNNNNNIFADFDTKNEVDIVKSYELIPFNDINFKEALDILLL